MHVMHTFTPLQSLLLFQSIAIHGTDHQAFDAISSSLANNELFRDGLDADTSPAALKDLYLAVLKEEARRERNDALDREDAHNGTAPPASPRKRKQRSPVMPTIEEARQHTHLIPRIIPKLYASYRSRIIDEIRQEERTYDGLLREVRDLEEQEKQKRADAASAAAATAATATTAAASVPTPKASSADATNSQLPKTALTASSPSPAAQPPTPKLDSSSNQPQPISQVVNGQTTTLPPPEKTLPSQTAVATQPQPQAQPPTHPSAQTSAPAQQRSKPPTIAPAPVQPAHAQTQSPYQDGNGVAARASPAVAQSPVVPPPAQVPPQATPQAPLQAAPPQQQSHQQQPLQPQQAPYKQPPSAAKPAPFPPSSPYGPGPAPTPSQAPPTAPMQHPHPPQARPTPPHAPQVAYQAQRTGPGANATPHGHPHAPHHSANAPAPPPPPPKGGIMLPPFHVNPPQPPQPPHAVQQQAPKPHPFHPPQHTQTQPQPQHHTAPPPQHQPLPQHPHPSQQAHQPQPQARPEVLRVRTSDINSPRTPPARAPSANGTPLGGPQYSHLKQQNDVVRSPGSSTGWKVLPFAPSSAPATRPRSRSISPLSDKEGDGKHLQIVPQDTPSAIKSTAKTANKPKPIPRSVGRPARGVSKTPSVAATSTSRARTRSGSPIDELSIDDSRSIKNEVNTPTVDDVEVKSTRPSKRAPPIPASSKRKRANTEEKSTPDSVAPLPAESDALDTVVCVRNFAKIAGPILANIRGHKHGSIFENPVKERDAEGYHDIIRRPQNFKSIEKAISFGTRAVRNALASTDQETTNTGDANTAILPISEDLVPPKAIVNPGQLEQEIMRMFANAVMFNPGEDEMVEDTREMFEHTLQILDEWRQSERIDDDADELGEDDTTIMSNTTKRRRL